MTSPRPSSPKGGLPMGTIGGIAAIVILALVGIAMLGYALSNVFGSPAATPTAQIAEVASATPALVLPTTTPVPPTAAPSATVPLETATTAPTNTPEGAATATLPSGGSAVGDLHVLVVAANVRAAPNAEAQLLGTIDGGSSAKVVGRNEAGDWLAVDFNGQVGWVSTTVATFVGDDSTLPVLTPNAPLPTSGAAATQPAATAQPGAATATPAAASGDTVTANTGGANVRSGPGTVYQIIGGLDGGKTAVVKGRNAGNDWLAIDFNGTTGWVYTGVVTYGGTIANLPIVAAPPAPSGSGSNPAPVATTAPTSAAPAPTAAPAQTGPIAVGAGSRGITGKLEIDTGRLTYGLNERIWFWEEIKNTTSANIQYGLFGVEAQNVATGAKIFQTSWSALSAPLQIDAGCIGPTDHCGGKWRDGMNIGTAGQYRLHLAICYNITIPECNQAGAQWEYLTDAVLITVQ